MYPHYSALCETSLDAYRGYIGAYCEYLRAARACLPQCGECHGCGGVDDGGFDVRRIVGGSVGAGGSGDDESGGSGVRSQPYLCESCRSSVPCAVPGRGHDCDGGSAAGDGLASSGDRLAACGGAPVGSVCDGVGERPQCDGVAAGSAGDGSGGGDGSDSSVAGADHSASASSSGGGVADVDVGVSGSPEACVSGSSVLGVSAGVAASLAGNVVVGEGDVVRGKHWKKNRAAKERRRQGRARVLREHQTVDEELAESLRKRRVAENRLAQLRAEAKASPYLDGDARKAYETLRRTRMCAVTTKLRGDVEEAMSRCSTIDPDSSVSLVEFREIARENSDMRKENVQLARLVTQLGGVVPRPGEQEYNLPDEMPMCFDFEDFKATARDRELYALRGFD